MATQRDFPVASLACCTSARGPDVGAVGDDLVQLPSSFNRVRAKGATGRARQAFCYGLHSSQRLDATGWTRQAADPVACRQVRSAHGHIACGDAWSGCFRNKVQLHPASLSGARVPRWRKKSGAAYRAPAVFIRGFRTAIRPSTKRAPADGGARPGHGIAARRHGVVVGARGQRQGPCRSPVGRAGAVHCYVPGSVDEWSARWLATRPG